MATINLGSIKFKWQGAYNGATAYAVDDVVSYNGSSYVCILASTGNLPTDGTYWNIMSQKGTDGTDITSIVGLAQGDLLYYDGSNWVRLGAGTSGQVLQTGGAGANPSWGTVSSDFVKLAEATASSSTEINFEDYYSSTYQSYQILGYNIQNSIAAELGFRFATGAGKTYTTTDYYSLTHGAYTNHGATVDSNWNNRNTNSSELRVSFDAGTSSTQLCHFRANFYNLNDASGAYKSFDCFKRVSENTWIEANFHTSGEARNVTLANNVITGIKILPTNGNFVKGKFVLYGIK